MFLEFIEFRTHKKISIRKSDISSIELVCDGSEEDGYNYEILLITKLCTYVIDIRSDKEDSLKEYKEILEEITDDPLLKDISSISASLYFIRESLENFNFYEASSAICDNLSKVSTDIDGLDTKLFEINQSIKFI